MVAISCFPHPVQQYAIIHQQYSCTSQVLLHDIPVWACSTDYRVHQNHSFHDETSIIFLPNIRLSWYQIHQRWTSSSFTNTTKKRSTSIYFPENLRIWSQRRIMYSMTNNLISCIKTTLLPIEVHCIFLFIFCCPQINS